MYEIIKEPCSEENGEHLYYNSILTYIPDTCNCYNYIHLLKDADYLNFCSCPWSYKRKQLTQTKVL